MNLRVYLGVYELLKPFRKHLPEVRFIRVVQRSVGHKQWEIDVSLLDGNKQPVAISETDELKSIASIWGERCFGDWLHNVAGDVVFQNMTDDEAIEAV